MTNNHQDDIIREGDWVRINGTGYGKHDCAKVIRIYEPGEYAAGLNFAVISVRWGDDGWDVPYAFDSATKVKMTKTGKVYNNL